MKRDVSRKQKHLKQAASELKRIEGGRPVLLENIEFIPHASGEKALLVITRGAHEKDRRNVILRWLVPASPKRQIRLDRCGTFVAGMINGKQATRDMISAFAQAFGVSEDESRTSCLLFLHSLARRGVIAIIEK